VTRSLTAPALLLALAVSCAPQPPVTAPAPPAPAPAAAATAAPPNPPPPAPARAFSAEYPWQPDRLDGTFKNPVLYADYSDPDAIRVGDDYYMVASSFQCTPGLPILESRDLVNWTLVGHALENLPDPRYAEVRHGEGIWAPALREHGGKFFIFAPTPDEGIYVLTAPHPRGPWSKPKMLAAGKGLIDPCPLWDDDGKAYLVHAYARSRAGIRDRLRVRPMAPDATKLLGDGEIVFMQPERQPTIEGPKFHKRNGWYYILAPAGGVPTGWQVVLRSRNVYGPYEDRNMLAQGTTPVNGPHQGALVDTRHGEWWFLHFQDAGIYGRVVHLNPVTWVDHWPLMGVRAPGATVGEPVLEHKKPTGLVSPAAVPATSDDFDSPKLGLQWQWHANHRNGWFSLGARKGFLRLFPQPAPGDVFSKVPHLLLQKLPARSFVVETAIELEKLGPGGRAGLIVMGESHAALAVEEAEKGLRVSVVVDDAVRETADAPRGRVLLRVHFDDGGLCRFSYRGDSERKFDGEFQAKPGRWIGTKVGLFAMVPDGTKPRGQADFDYFRFAAATTTR
jgi:beta-xylosidase